MIINDWEYFTCYDYKFNINTESPLITKDKKTQRSNCVNKTILIAIRSCKLDTQPWDYIRASQK